MPLESKDFVIKKDKKNVENSLDSVLGTFFLLQANWFLLFYKDLAVSIFTTLLADIQDPFESRHRVPNP